MQPLTRGINRVLIFKCVNGWISMIAFYQCNPFSHMIWCRCLLHVSRVLSPPHELLCHLHYFSGLSKICGWPSFVPRQGCKRQKNILGEISRASQWTHPSQGTHPSSTHHKGRTDSPDMFQRAGGDQITYWYEPETESHSTEPWSPLLADHWWRSGSSPGLFHSRILQKSCQDQSAVRRMFWQHFCLLFAAEATWCMRLILCRQAATNLLG